METSRAIHVRENVHFANIIIFHIQERDQRYASALVDDRINLPNEMPASFADRPTNENADHPTVFQAKPRPPSPPSPHNRDLSRKHDLNFINQFFPEYLRPAPQINLAKVFGASVSLADSEAVLGCILLDSIPYQGRSRWTHYTVAEVLTQPKYAGFHVYGRTTSRLYTPTVRLPKSDWLVSLRAFGPVVNYSTFLEAQRILQSRTINKSDDELLESLRALVAREGRLSLRLVKDSPDVPSPSTYRHRFGSLRRADELIGYGRPDQFGPIDLRRRTQALRDELITRIAALFPNDVSIVRRGVRWRSRLRMRSGLTVCVLLARSIRAWKETVRWQIDPVKRERKHVTMLARLDEKNRCFLDYHVLPSIDRPRRFHIRHADTWLDRGMRLEDLSAFLRIVTQVAR